MLNNTINGYTIQTLLGKGGMAEVYYAENRLHKRAAIKVLRSELESNDDIRQRFVREAETIAFLEHPNIRQVFDMGHAEGRSFIIMEYMEGMDLKQYISRHGAVPENTATKWVAEALRGLGYAHSNEVVHRDIKPANIFLTDDGKVKLMDFGIAKVKSEGLGLTGTNTRMGTPIFMSPEQIRTPKAVDHRTDIYSMGVTLWTLLNGKPPYNEQTESEYELMDSIVRQPLPPLSNVSLNVRRAILLATAKDTATRLTGCNEMVEALIKDIKVVPSAPPLKSDAIDGERTIVDNSPRNEHPLKVAAGDQTPDLQQVDAERKDDSNSYPALPAGQASLGKRCGASLLDYLVIRVVQGILLFVFVQYFYTSIFHREYLQDDIFGLGRGYFTHDWGYDLEDDLEVFLLFINPLELFFAGFEWLRFMYDYSMSLYNYNSHDALYYLGWFGIPFAILHSSIPFFYLSLSDRFFSGRSVGKLLFGLRVHRIEGGPKLTFWVSLKRQFLKLVTLINIPGWITYFSSEEKSLLFHDRICGTVVVASKKDLAAP